MTREPLDLRRLGNALPGRAEEMWVPDRHFVNGNPLKPPFPPCMHMAMFAMGCFWGPERLFWRTPGVYTTAAGYSGGSTPNPEYEEVCTGRTGHAECVRVVFDPAKIPFEGLLKIFWEHHDPTEGMRQGNDFGTQYRSVIFAYTATQMRAGRHSRRLYQRELRKAGLGRITTRIQKAPLFYYGEELHQQYHGKVPAGHCAMGGTGVSYPGDRRSGVAPLFPPAGGEIGR